MVRRLRAVSVRSKLAKPPPSALVPGRV
jgi:hypothetical protein